MYIRAYVHVHVYLYLYVYVWYVNVCMCMCACMNIYVSVDYMHVYICMFVHVFIYIHVFVCIQTAVLLVITCVYSNICYWMVGMSSYSLSTYIYFNLVLFLVINISCAICQFVAAFSTNIPMAVCIYMVVVAYMLLFGGFLVNSNDLPKNMRWILEVCTYIHIHINTYTNIILYM